MCVCVCSNKSVKRQSWLTYLFNYLLIYFFSQCKKIVQVNVYIREQSISQSCSPSRSQFKFKVIFRRFKVTQQGYELFCRV